MSYMMLDIRYWYMIIWYLIYDMRYDITYSTWYMVYRTWYIVSGISYLVSRTWYIVYGMKWYDMILYEPMCSTRYTSMPMYTHTHIYIHIILYIIVNVLYSVWNNVAAAFTKIWRWRFCEALNITPRLCARASSWTSLACRCRESLSTCTNRPLSHMRNI